MPKIEFEDITFKEQDNQVVTTFLKIYEFRIEKEELQKTGEYKIKDNTIEFKNISEEKANHKINFIIEKGLNNLTNKVTKNKTIYIHKQSKIPLIGTTAFGIVDKGTNMIEIKPNTGCNIDCIYCSVDEGINSKKQIDFVIEEEYLIEELNKLLDFKKQDNMQIYINPNGEPLLYQPLTKLIQHISKNPYIDSIHLISNGTLLSKQLIDKLKEAGLTNISLSLSAIDDLNIMGKQCNIKHIAEMAEYASKKIKLTLTPVWIQGINDEEIEKLIGFAKKIKAEIAIQNLLLHKGGRKPVKKELPWQDFYNKLQQLENKHKIQLSFKDKQPKTIKTKEYEMPFKRNDVIEAKIVSEGRAKNEKLATAKNRIITVLNTQAKNKIKLRILRATHNIFLAKQA